MASPQGVMRKKKKKKMQQSQQYTSLGNLYERPIGSMPMPMTSVFVVVVNTDIGCLRAERHMSPRHRDLFPPLVDGGVAAFWIRLLGICPSSRFIPSFHSSGAPPVPTQRA
jgi:hypothetical protein